MFKDYKVRQWIYGIIAAGFAVLAGYGIITSDQIDNWLKLAEATLNLVPAAALTLAAAKAKPANSDVVNVQVADDDVVVVEAEDVVAVGKHGTLE